jgi:uncharacterized protein
MAHNVFVDTSGLYSFLVKKDERHEHASAIVQKSLKEGHRFVTTDYVIDETATLLKARDYFHGVASLFEGVFASRACTMEWMDQEYFEKTKALFLKYNDHQWSFTDCFSFICMRAKGITAAITHDIHFKEAGFDPLLA